MRDKLIQWGWCDKHGHSLTWQDLQKKPHRVPVTYLRDDGGNFRPIYDAYSGPWKRT